MSKRVPPTITIGFSVNSEFHYEGIDVSGSEKGKLERMYVELGGSSANVATCLKNLGKNPNLIIPTDAGNEDSLERDHLNRALRQVKVTHTFLPVLEGSPAAVCPDGQHGNKRTLVYGRKGTLKKRDRDSSLSLEEAIADDPILEAGEKLKNVVGQWRIATGVDIATSQLVNVFLSYEDWQYPGYRVFSPHNSICSDETLRGAIVSYILQKTDLFILNKVEFESLDMTHEDIHKKGVSVIVVTDGVNGGTFSICNASTRRKVQQGSYKAVPIPPGTKLYKLGSGDWFSGGLCNHIIDYCNHTYSLKNISFKQIERACEFGAMVAAKKITMKGVSTGPTLEDFAVPIEPLTQEIKKELAI